MSELIVDLSNYKERVGGRVEPGPYTVIVEDAEMDKSKQGNTMVNLWLRVQGGEHDGATIIDRLVVSEKSLFRVVGFLQAIGLPTPKKRIKLNIARFINKRLIIEVDDGQPYNGRVKSEVRGYERITSSTAGADEPEEPAAQAGDADLEDDGMAEFTPEKTSNPARRNGQASADDEQDSEELTEQLDEADDEPEEQPVPRKRVASKEAAAPEEVDLDTLDID